MRPYFLLTALALLLPLATHAATTGDLIKGSSSSVYYLNADGKRYVFPTEQTYRSWYVDFSGVKIVSDTEIASYGIGGNVTYRPGVRLVKVTTDPKVYAVSRGGALRWIQTEELARALYGADWARMIDDVPDAFFTNYHIGTPITVAADFIPTSERDAVATIQADKQPLNSLLNSSPSPLPLPSPSSPSASSTSVTSTVPLSASPSPAPFTVTIAPSKPSPRAGEIVNLLVEARPSGGVSLIKLFFDGQLQRSCEYSPCGGDVTIPTANTKPNYELRAETTWITGQIVVVTSTLPVGSGNAAINLSIPRPEVRPLGRREVIVTVPSNLFIAYTIDIFMDGNNVRGCNSVQDCRYITDETSSTGTVHTIYAIAGDRNGFTIRSETKTLSVVDNDHPVVTLLTGKSTLLIGETVDVTVSATDDDGVAKTEIWLDGNLLKTCNGSSCTAVAGPWTAARSFSFIGKAQDVLGLWAQATSTSVQVK